MSNYIVSARKYRPSSFRTVVGQQALTHTLKTAIASGRLAHAYLFCGPRGVGKTTCARIFAKAINCEHPTADGEACNECASCRAFNEQSSFNIIELDAASNNGVDAIRDLTEQVRIPPQSGRYKVYIIDEVHMLSQAAFNAFLKTLEEPPEYAIFVLATTEKQKVIPTILSRCQIYDFARITVPDIVQQLQHICEEEGVTAEPAALNVIAQKADGAMRDALTIFDQTVAFCGTEVKYEDVLRNLNVLDYEHCFRLVDAFLAGDYPTALLKFDEILSKGFNALHFVASLSSHLRDLMVARSGGLDALLELPESLKAKYREQAARCPMQFLYDALATTTACEAGYKAAVNPRLHIEFALMRLSFLCGSGEVSLRPAAPAAPVAKPVASAAPAVKPAPSSQPATPTAPAPAAPAAPAEPAPTRRRSAKTSGALSLTGIKEAEEAARPAFDPAAGGDVLPDDAKVAEMWKELAKDYAGRPRLASMLSTSKTEISEQDGTKVLSFYVMNVSQQDWIKEKILSEFETKLRRLLGTAKIRLEVLVTPDEEVKKINYTQQEQAAALMQDNPEVKNLVTDMGLDI